jgi:hypothetical protein
VDLRTGRLLTEYEATTEKKGDIMSVYEIGGFEECTAELEPIPDGKYSLAVEDYEETKTRRNRPMIIYTSRVIKPADKAVHNRKIRDAFVLPWVNPETGERETGGRFRLTQFITACGVTWQGTRFDPITLKHKQFKASIGREEIMTKGVGPGGEEILVGTGEYRNVITKYFPDKNVLGISEKPSAPPAPPKRHK